MLRERILIGHGSLHEYYGQLTGTKGRSDSLFGSNSKEKHRFGAGCFALAASEERSPGKTTWLQHGLPRKGVPSGSLARTAALVAQERREKTLRALEYIQKHQHLYHDAQATSVQKFLRGAAAKARLFPTPARADKSARKPFASTQGHKSAYARPEYQACAFDHYYTQPPKQRKFIT